ncbi:MAG: phosphonate ABC transporter ATP-binding protein [Actinomycetota bacterium]
MTAVAAIEVRGLCYSYGVRPILDGVSFAVEGGDMVALLGASGAGKTTLFRCLTRLVTPEAQILWVAGHPLHEPGVDLNTARRDIGVILQQFNLVRRLSALNNALMGSLGRVNLWRVMFGRFDQADRQLALASLDRVGLLEKAYQRADTLSGGEQQRVAIARTLTQQSRCILADEPVSSLDPQSAAVVLQILRDLAHDLGIGVLCNLHQVNLAVDYADRILGMSGGRIVVDTPASEFGPAHREAIYGPAAAQPDNALPEQGLEAGTNRH